MHNFQNHFSTDSRFCQEKSCEICAWGQTKEITENKKGRTLITESSASTNKEKLRRQDDFRTQLAVPS